MFMDGSFWKSERRESDEDLISILVLVATSAAVDTQCAIGDRHAFLGLSSTFQGSIIAFLHGVVPSGVCAMFSG
jgi:hypothetical protein